MLGIVSLNSVGNPVETSRVVFVRIDFTNSADTDCRIYSGEGGSATGRYCGYHTLQRPGTFLSSDYVLLGPKCICFEVWIIVGEPHFSPSSVGTESVVFRTLVGVL